MRTLAIPLLSCSFFFWYSLSASNRDARAPPGGVPLFWWRKIAIAQRTHRTLYRTTSVRGGGKPEATRSLLDRPKTCDDPDPDGALSSFQPSIGKILAQKIQTKSDLAKKIFMLQFFLLFFVPFVCVCVVCFYCSVFLFCFLCSIPFFVALFIVALRFISNEKNEYFCYIFCLRFVSSLETPSLF